jgi:uncharacterized protein
MRIENTGSLRYAIAIGFLDSRSAIRYIFHGFDRWCTPKVNVMKIQISGLSEGIHRYSFSVASNELELGEQFRSEVLVDATLDKTPTQILLTSNIITVGSFECDRCVAPFGEQLTSSYTMLYVHEGSETEYLDPEEFQVLSAGQNIIDLTEDVRQTLLLAVPFKLLCNKECKGLCPTCGVNLNQGSCSCKNESVDERWEQLLRLRTH